jgi:uncharacterized protein (DUF3820 family)
MSTKIKKVKPTVNDIEEPKEEIKTTYTERMCAQFIEDDNYSGYEIHKIIKEFSEAENKKKHADSSKMSFGKYNGKLIKEILQFDKQYLVWLEKQTILDNFKELKINIKSALA